MEHKDTVTNRPQPRDPCRDRPPSGEAGAAHYAAFARNRERAGRGTPGDRDSVAISGAVGTFANIDPYVEQ